MSEGNDQGNQDESFSLEGLDEQATGRIRRVWHEERWWFSMVDVVGLLSENPKPRQYWFDMKRTIHDEGFREVSEKIRQLKMQAPDGKQRLTDAGDTDTIFRIIQSIPSPKAEPFKQWLAKVGRERLDEIDNPELAADRMRKQYRALGYTDDWIDRRLQGIIIRDELTNEWHDRGAQAGKEFAALTETLQRGAFDLPTSEHRQVKHIEARTERPVVSDENYKTLRQGRQRKLQDRCFLIRIAATTAAAVTRDRSVSRWLRMKRTP